MTCHSSVKIVCYIVCCQKYNGNSSAYDVMRRATEAVLSEFLHKDPVRLPQDLVPMPCTACTQVIQNFPVALLP